MLYAQILFSIDLPYIQTQYNNLCKYAVHHYWKDSKTHCWIFLLDNKKDIETLLGIPIKTKDYEYDIKIAEVEKWKGKDMLQVVTYPKIYQVITHNKKEDGSIVEVKTDIPISLVDTIWKGVIRHMQTNHPVKSSTVAQNIVYLLRIDRFNRQTGSFDFSKFFGCRKDYFRLFYYPMKILENQGKIKHHKKGMIEKL